MAVKYGIDFPFRDSLEGHYLKMTTTPEREVRADLIHLLLTKKGSRYFLPDFGTRLYQFIFDQNDMVTFGLIEDEIRESVKKYIPNLDLTKNGGQGVFREFVEKILIENNLLDTALERYFKSLESFRQ